MWKLKPRPRFGSTMPGGGSLTMAGMFRGAWTMMMLATAVTCLSVCSEFGQNRTVLSLLLLLVVVVGGDGGNNMGYSDGLFLLLLLPLFILKSAYLIDGTLKS